MAYLKISHPLDHIKMQTLTIALVCLALPLAIHGDRITEIHTMTGNNPMNEGFGRISVTVTNTNGVSCIVSNLDEDGDDN